jgi:hypothetical protein
MSIHCKDGLTKTTTWLANLRDTEPYGLTRTVLPIFCPSHVSRNADTVTRLSIIDNNLLQNCPANQADVIAAERISGPDKGSLKGKTVRTCPGAVRIDMMNDPISIITKYQQVKVSANIMFVNNVDK